MPDIQKSPEASHELPNEETDSLTVFSSPREVLQMYGEWFILLCMRYIRQTGDAMLNENGGYAPKSVSMAKILAGLTGSNSPSAETWLNEHGVPTMDAVARMLAQITQAIRIRTEHTFESCALEQTSFSDILVIESLRQAFGLSDIELNIIIILALIQYDERYARVWRFASGENPGSLVSVSFLANILSYYPPEEFEEALLPTSRLRRHALIELRPREGWGNETPRNFAAILTPNRILAFILGEPYITELTACHFISLKPCELRPGDKEIARLFTKKSLKAAVVGYAGLGRTQAVCRAAQRAFACILEFDLAVFAESEPSKDALRSHFAAMMREIRLRHALLVIRIADLNEDAEKYCKRNAHIIRDVLNEEPYLKYCVITERQTAFTRRLFGELTEIICAPPDKDSQYIFWKQALEKYISTAAAEAVASELSLGYCLSENEIQNTIDQTFMRSATVTPDTLLTAENITQTLNRTRGHKLNGIASMRSTSLLLRDIVLSDDLRSTLDEVIAYAKYRDTVMNKWGFSKYNASGAGLSVLLSGPPGTGKTLTALVLAHELRRALYVVDLSKVVDKYVGETEKKLSVLFDEAEKSQAMLLFDEADALFAKRTSVKSSNDRYANLEVNFLLQKLEAYPGVAILTTNLLEGLDEALARRIQFKIYIPMPDASARAELWKHLIPPRAPVSDDIIFEALGEHFEMSGGHIKNAIMRAGIRAASKGTPISHALLWDSAVQEFRDMGHVVRDIK